jgi:hypothetical protein
MDEVESYRAGPLPAISKSLIQFAWVIQKKLKMALRLRQESTMTTAWIAQRLQMGTKSHLTHLLYWEARKRMDETCQY